MQAGASDAVCTVCMVHTSWWQLAQMHDPQDDRPYLAYMRVLRHLDSHLEAKFLSWVTECLQVTQYSFLSEVLRTILHNIDMTWKHSCIDDNGMDGSLRPWEVEFLDDPLGHQWLDLEASASSSLLERRSSQNTRRSLSARLSRSSLTSPVQLANELYNDSDFIAMLDMLQPTDCSLDDNVLDNPTAERLDHQPDSTLENAQREEALLHSQPMQPVGVQGAEQPVGVQGTEEPVGVQGPRQATAPQSNVSHMDAASSSSFSYAANDPSWDKYVTMVQQALCQHQLTELDIGQLLFQMRQVRHNPFSR